MRRKGLGEREKKKERRRKRKGERKKEKEKMRKRGGGREERGERRWEKHMRRVRHTFIYVHIVQYGYNLATEAKFHCTMQNKSCQKSFRLEIIGTGGPNIMTFAYRST